MLLSLTINALVIGSVYGLIALGYSLIYSASGLMTFCQGELLMFGAFYRPDVLQIPALAFCTGADRHNGDHVPDRYDH